MELNRFIVVISAHKSQESLDINTKNTDRLRGQLRSEGLCFQFDEVQGMYKGEAEPAFAVQCNDFSDVGTLLYRAREYNQESIMLIDARKRAYLLFCDTSELVYLSTLYSRSADSEIPRPDNYTLHGDVLYYTL